MVWLFIGCLRRLFPKPLQLEQPVRGSCAILGVGSQAKRISEVPLVSTGGDLDELWPFEPGAGPLQEAEALLRPDIPGLPAFIDRLAVPHLCQEFRIPFGALGVQPRVERHLERSHRASVH